MNILQLKRIQYHPEATFGCILHQCVPLCVTLEDPWRFNETSKSCIPAGAYEVSKWDSQKYPNTFILGNVPFREAILIHSGNYPSDTQGCILPGLSFGVAERNIAVANSTAALNILRTLTKNWDKFILEVTDPS